MRAVVSLKRGYTEGVELATPRTSDVMVTTWYDLLMALQCIYGPHNDDFVLTLVAYWWLSGHLQVSTEALAESGWLPDEEAYEVLRTRAC